MSRLCLQNLKSYLYLMDTSPRAEAFISQDTKSSGKHLCHNFVPQSMPLHVHSSIQQIVPGQVGEALLGGPGGILGYQQCWSDCMKPIWQPECASGQPDSISGGAHCCCMNHTAFCSLFFYTETSQYQILAQCCKAVAHLLCAVCGTTNRSEALQTANACLSGCALCDQKRILTNGMGTYV